ncbi:MAG: histidine triad nucleotide-binding protein [Desulfobacterales bacterium]|jgi:histidine triad (HIT) family protein
MTEDCIFCPIAQGQTETELLFEDEQMVAFRDIHPHAPVHILIVPKKHIRSINDLEPEDHPLISALISRAQKVALVQGIAETGYKLVFNVEWGGGQRVFHLHLHLLGGWKTK